LKSWADDVRQHSPQKRSRAKKDPRKTGSVCRRIGLTQHFADMLPADKANVIQDLQREGKSSPWWDGINDSA
jgi:cation transport ATPase